jgi:C4-dicarboxylate-specific signal transduction histidine kinase
MTLETLNSSALKVPERTQALSAPQDALAALAALEAELAETRRLALHAEMQSRMDWQAARQTVAGLAHAINQPLASVAVLCEALSIMLTADGLETAALNAPAAQLQIALQQLAGETERAGALVRQLPQAVSPPG